MTLLRDQDDKWAVLEMLLRHTVHRVLFQEPETSPVVDTDSAQQQQQQVDAEAVAMDEPLPLLVSSRAKNLEEDPDLQCADHCKRVMECQHWTSEELRQEKEALKEYLVRQQRNMARQQPAGEHNQQVSSELYCTFEAYALLKLFLLERSTMSIESLGSSLKHGNDRDRLLLLLHVQLELYAKYVEQSQQLEVRI